MTDGHFKQLYAILVFVLTVLWAVFCCWITMRATVLKESIDIMAAAGVNVLLGALIVWNGNINQHYFRKKTTEE